MDVYKRDNSRSFAAESMKALLGDDIWTKLTNASVISNTGEERRFEHQLFHDFLASVELLSMESAEWTHELLDAVTFHTSSIDPLTFALAQIIDVEQGNKFLRALEDWNWLMTMTAMGIVEKEGHLRVSRELRIALLGNLAEKLFDPISASADDARQRLQGFDGEEAAEMMTASDAVELARIVGEMTVDAPVKWYQDWRDLFSRQEQLIDLTSREIAHTDALEGWTAANVIRRFPLTERQEVELASIYQSRRSDSDARSKSIRWRAIHAMGATRSLTGVELLLDAAANDPYLWARYGAIRSLMEIAARDTELRVAVIDGLRPLLSRFDARERTQLVRSARQQATSDGWCPEVRPLLNDVPQDDLTERERANLRLLLHEFEEGCP